jgi:hypothetical protein
VNDKLAFGTQPPASTQARAAPPPSRLPLGQTRAAGH